MRVKSIAVFAATALAVAGCALGAGQLESRVIESKPGSLGRQATLVDAGDRLLAVSADVESASLAVYEIPAQGLTVPDAFPRPTLEDKIGAAPTLGEDFGDHAAAILGGTFHVLYAGRAKDDRSVLRWLQKQPGATQWDIDALEPSGEPLALVQGQDGKAVAFWSSGSSLDMSIGSDSRVETAVSGFAAGSRATLVPGGFVVYDTVSARLIYVSMTARGVRVQAIRNSWPTSSATLTSRGVLAVATFDPSHGRIMLLESAGPVAGIDSTELPVKTTIVTPSRNTAGLVIAPRKDGYVFLYDENTGPKMHALYLLAQRGRRYERWQIGQTESPISSISAVVRDNTLYALVAGETLKLVAVNLP